MVFCHVTARLPFRAPRTLVRHPPLFTKLYTPISTLTSSTTVIPHKNLGTNKMSGAEAEEAQSAIEDGGQGPGAPTPLIVLEVRYHDCDIKHNSF